MRTGRPAASVAPAEEACCRSCAHFENEPQHLERSFPGWRALGSAYGSTRSEDGICGARGLYLSARQWCVQYVPRRGS
ncbi:MAG TPA: hypothetical protein VF229_08270 [Burkholderiaceae bacterium]